jgi:UDP-N-acetylglucosamine 2-epimerase (non-hydrolysing)
LRRAECVLSRAGGTRRVEAGLQSGDFEPFPEEMNRVLATRLATLHFAPTDAAAENLLREGVASDRILVTGTPASTRC